MKSGRFTAAQNKEEGGEYVDSVGELVAIDKVDRTLQDLEQYTRTLIKEETNLDNLVNAAIKDIALDKERESHIDADDNGQIQDEETQLFDYENIPSLTIDDQEEFTRALEEDKRSDEAIFEEGEEL